MLVNQPMTSEHVVILISQAGLIYEDTKDLPHRLHGL